jgi:hypothetical protein
MNNKMNNKINNKINKTNNIKNIIYNADGINIIFQEDEKKEKNNNISKIKKTNTKIYNNIYDIEKSIKNIVDIMHR